LETGITGGTRLKTATNIRAPAHLSPAMRTFYLEKRREYAMQSHHLRLLQLACEAWDRAQQAREILATDGITVGGREGIKPHPAIAIERDSRLAFARLIAQLSLDDEQPVSPSTRDALRSTRPGGWRGLNG
jgi:phage terminase small subunit